MPPCRNLSSSWPATVSSFSPPYPAPSRGGCGADRAGRGRAAGAPEGYRAHESLAPPALPRPPARRPARRLVRQPLRARRRRRRRPQEAPSPSQVRASLQERRNSAAAMASNMDREMILADFQVKYLPLLSHLPPARTEASLRRLLERCGGVGEAFIRLWLRVCVCEP